MAFGSIPLRRALFREPSGEFLTTVWKRKAPAQRYTCLESGAPNQHPLADDAFLIHPQQWPSEFLSGSDSATAQATALGTRSEPLQAHSSDRRCGGGRRRSRQKRPSKCCPSKSNEVHVGQEHPNVSWVSGMCVADTRSSSWTQTDWIQAGYPCGISRSWSSQKLYAASPSVGANQWGQDEGWRWIR